MIKILTRCTRPENLERIYKSLPQSSMIEWIIIFDTYKLKLIETKYLSYLESLNDWDNSDIQFSVYYYFWEGIGGSDMGHTLLNKIINLMPENYYYILDDDTIMHPNLKNLIESRKIKDYIEVKIDQMFDRNHDILIGNQYVGGYDFSGLQIREAKPENMKMSQVDMGQMIVWGEFWKEMGGLIPNDYCADGYLIEKMYNTHPEKFYFLDEIISFYNVNNFMK